MSRLRVTKATPGVVRKKLQEFERKYNMSSSEFYQLYNEGKLGDDIKFVRWASLYNLAAKLGIVQTTEV